SVSGGNLPDPGAAPRDHLRVVLDRREGDTQPDQPPSPAVQIAHFDARDRGTGRSAIGATCSDRRGAGSDAVHSASGRSALLAGAVGLADPPRTRHTRPHRPRTRGARPSVAGPGRHVRHPMGVARAARSTAWGILINSLASGDRGRLQVSYTGPVLRVP